MNTAFWRDKKVLITGHTGFKGTWLSLWLERLGAQVTGYALSPETNSSMFEQLQLDQRIDSVISDIRDLEKLKQVLSDTQPDIVFHLAAQALVKPSYQDPITTYQTNVMGTVNLLEAVRHQDSVAAVVVVTTDKCYENHEWVWPYRENDRLGGYDPYSNSKACAELVTDSYRNSFFSSTGTAVASARAGNVIGGGDWSDYRLIPDMIRAKQTGKPMEVRNPNSVRPWQHVLEPLSGYLKLAESLVLEPGNYDAAWNFGPNADDMVAVIRLVEKAKQKWPSFEWQHLPQPQHHEANMLMLDCSKAHNQLGWTPKWQIDEALDHTFDWYDACLSGSDMMTVTLQQIQLYEASLKEQAV